MGPLNVCVGFSQIRIRKNPKKALKKIQTRRLPRSSSTSSSTTTTVLDRLVLNRPLPTIFENFTVPHWGVLVEAIFLCES